MERICKICKKKMGNCYTRDIEGNYFHPICQNDLMMNLDESLERVLKNYGNSGCYLYLPKKYAGRRVKITFI